jgi:hypothetical protein
MGIQLYLKNARRTSFDVSSEHPLSDLIRRRSRTSSDEGVGPHPTKESDLIRRRSRTSYDEGVGPHTTKESDLIRRRSRTSSDEGVGPHPTKESDLIRRRSRTSSDEGVGPHPTKDLRPKRRGSPCILALPVMDLAVLKKNDISKVLYTARELESFW